MAQTEDHAVGLDQYETLPRRILTVWLPLFVFVFVLLFPFYWMAITAVKPDNQLTDYANHSPFWVVGPTLEHIRTPDPVTDWDGARESQLLPQVSHLFVQFLQRCGPPVGA